MTRAYPRVGDSLLLLSRHRQIRHQLGVVFCAGGDLDEGHAELGGEELFGVGAGVGFDSFAVLDDEVHLLDAFAPDDVVVLPELRHGDVLFMHARVLVSANADAAVAVVLPFVGDVTDAPGGGFAAGGFLEDFEAHTDGAVAVVHGGGPVLRALRVEAVAFDVVVRLAGLGVVGLNDLLEEGEEPQTAQPLDASHVPANWNTSGVVALKSIGHATNVNALADDQTLNFAEVGLTVVYGDNGAGKSGYGRVLKRACRARDQEDILPNAYATPTGRPSAQIKYSVASTIQPEVAWQDGVAASPDLSNISVFDSKCASVQVGGPNELAYTPVPLQLLQALADLVRDFAGKLKTKKGVLEGQVPSCRKKPASRDGTGVHQLIVGLSATTQAMAITSLVQMSDDEAQRLEELKGTSKNPCVLT